MPYIMRSHTKDGISVERVNGRVRELLERRDWHGDRTYSETGKPVGLQDKHHQEDVKMARSTARPNNGFTKKRLFRHIGRIPAEAMAHFRQHVASGDTKTLKAFIKGQGFNTVRKNSF